MSENLSMILSKDELESLLERNHLPNRDFLDQQELNVNKQLSGSEQPKRSYGLHPALSSAIRVHSN